MDGRLSKAASCLSHCSEDNDRSFDNRIKECRDEADTSPSSCREPGWPVKLSLSYLLSHYLMESLYILSLKRHLHIDWGLLRKYVFDILFIF